MVAATEDGPKASWIVMVALGVVGLAAGVRAVVLSRRRPMRSGSA
jgi:MYXO-CTERM domain-containing protein